MALTLEQEMITVLKNCVDTSQLKAIKHEDLNQKGYLNWELFSAESWAIRFRNEPTSQTKRTYLDDMAYVLARNHNVMVDRAVRDKDQYDPAAEKKTKGRIVEEINIQITHFNTLQTILAHYRKQIEATITLTAKGGESLVALIRCETILEGAISGWIAQMQGHEFHTKGVFPIVYRNTDTRSAGTRFSDDVRALIASGQALVRANKRDPLSNNDDDDSGIMFDKDVTGLYERAALNGDKPKAAVANVVSFSAPRPITAPIKKPSSMSMASSSASSSPSILTSDVKSAASAPDASPPIYYISNPFEQAEADAAAAEAAAAAQNDGGNEAKRKSVRLNDR